MRDYFELGTVQRGDFEVVFDWTYEDLDPRYCFEESDVDEIIESISDDRCTWFMLRARVFLDSVELADEYLGGLLYEDPVAVMTDGVADDLADQAVDTAQQIAVRLLKKLASSTNTLESYAV